MDAISIKYYLNSFIPIRPGKEPKDGSWNPMISAHLIGQIFANIETSPYCFMGGDQIPQLLTLLSLKVIFRDGQIPPNTVTCPLTWTMSPTSDLKIYMWHANYMVFRILILRV